MDSTCLQKFAKVIPIKTSHNIRNHQDTSGSTSSNWACSAGFPFILDDTRRFLMQDGEAVWSSWLKEPQSCKNGVLLSSMHFLDSMSKWLVMLMMVRRLFAAHLTDISAQKSKASHMRITRNSIRSLVLSWLWTLSSFHGPVYTIGLQKLRKLQAIIRDILNCLVQMRKQIATQVQ